MGLNTTHGAWDGAYSAFHRWRTEVCKVAGMPPLGAMEGFWNDASNTKKIVENIQESWIKDALKADVLDGLPIRWEALKPDALHVLLYHSDCDGEISPEDCALIADRLEELLPAMPDGEAGGHIGNWRDKTSTFIEGCRAAAAAGEPLGFH